MIQAEYVKTALCNGCGVVGCLLIRAGYRGYYQKGERAASIRLCHKCFGEAAVEVGRGVEITIAIRSD